MLYVFDKIPLDPQKRIFILTS